ncbi:MAG: hypothetical protein ACREM8_06115 [Vulcanimicrobiaceae bacterium]
MKRTIILAATIGLLAGCAQPSADIGTLNLARVQANWPKFINYQNQLAADESAIERAKVSDGAKAAERDELRRRYAAMQSEIERDVETAAAQVAQERHMKLIVTREFVGYGGVDVTPDVEKILKISEPKPSSS